MYKGPAAIRRHTRKVEDLVGAYFPAIRPVRVHPIEKVSPSLDSTKQQITIRQEGWSVLDRRRNDMSWRGAMVCRSDPQVGEPTLIRRGESDLFSVDYFCLGTCVAIGR
jgi:hypothetical protein